MILPARPALDETCGPRADSEGGWRPWAEPERLDRLVLLCLWATGSDPEVDGVFRVQALRRDPSGGAWERFDRFCDPFAGRGAAGRSLATARMAREYGVNSSYLEGAPAVEEVWDELVAFAGDGPLIVPNRAEFAPWAETLGEGLAEGPPELDLLGAEELRALLLPGRDAAGHPPTDPRARYPRAVGPEELQVELATAVGAFCQLGRAPLAVAAQGYAAAARALAPGAPRAARTLGLALTLVEFPSRWGSDPGGLFPAAPGLVDGRLSAAVEKSASAEAVLSAARPRWAERLREWLAEEPLPPDDERPLPFEDEDRRRVDEIFEVHLPRHFAAAQARPSQPGSESYRAGQHGVAREVAASLGARELLLVHAPTGTGKTLGYLVPALLWAARHRIRLGVATYTRALQEQAMDREVPLALEMLRRVGLEELPRVSVLKGRRNYLCWRALHLQAPQSTDPAPFHLAWTLLALFALSDPDGDLDRFSLRPPLADLEPRQLRRELWGLVRSVRAESGCCLHREDRERCAAEAARRRAERSHLVLTNHSFALARREFFRHLVFDECEHLHDQAHSAWSHEIPVEATGELLGRLWRGRPSSGAPLDRLLDRAPEGSAAHGCAAGAARIQGQARRALEDLQQAVFDFKDWRDETGRERQARDAHSLFREYAQSEADGAEQLLDAHARLARSLDETGARLAELSEHLDEVPLRGGARLRRRFDVLRAELDELLEGVRAWIPRGERGGPAFRGDIFYDVQTDARGRDVLEARVLLPHEFLGRVYYPELAGAVFLSASTWIRGGFEAASAYLGLDRAAHPAEEEEREPRSLRTFRAPEVFDYSRVLVAVPKDAPDVGRDKRAFLDYARRFVAHLGERTRGRVLVLFTNGEDCRRVGRSLEDFFASRHLPLYYQRGDGATKEELSRRFRERTDSILMGLDTFWYGADFPGETLEYLVLIRLPYGVPDRYHHAQCAALGSADQRRRIYMPRALAKFRQGFGRLMRSESDRGCVFLLDSRVLSPRHRAFLAELPVVPALGEGSDGQGARLVRGETDRCLREAFAHMELGSELKRRGLERPFAETRLEGHPLDPGRAAREPGGPLPF